MLTVFGHPPWAASEEKTPQSGLIRKVTDNHTTWSQETGWAQAQSTCTQRAAGAQKRAQGRVRSTSSYGSKRKMSSAEWQSSCGLAQDTDQRVQTIHPTDGSLSGSHTSHPWNRVDWLSELHSSNKYPPSAYLVINALSTALKAAIT